jgi:2',3'-cyclic-nucleotide 3'-phosphodiesterase
MPGASLWLVPPEDSELYKAVHDLILNKIPAVYPDASPARFTPHITLTSDVILADFKQPQEWLDNLTLHDGFTNEYVRLNFMQVDTPFFKKLTISCEPTKSLLELAAHCRTAGVENVDSKKAWDWANDEYKPHCSLM